MKLTFREAKLDSGWLCLKVNELAPARKFVLEHKDKLYDCEIREHREKRSLDANAYAWVLMTRLAVAIGVHETEIYRMKVREVGPYKDFILTPDEAKTFRVAWEALGTAWPTEQVDFEPDGEHVRIRAYYGSSQYNTKQMSRLIDSIVADCEAVGIETMTPDKIALLKEEWRK